MQHNPGSSNDNEPHVIILIDRKLRDVPCVFCLALGRTRSKATHPHLDFWGNERHTICTEHVEAALSAINNKDRNTAPPMFDSMRKFFEERVKEGQ